jgi:hypothetical protein
MLRLEHLPRWLRVPIRGAFYAVAVTFVLSLLPVWNTYDAKSTTPGLGRGPLWEEVGNALYGDHHRPGVYAERNLLVLAAVLGLAFLVGLVGFWFGPRVKDKDDEPHRLRRPWEPRHAT